jgi:hypothetical protein
MGAVMGAVMAVQRTIVGVEVSGARSALAQNCFFKFFTSRPEETSITFNLNNAARLRNTDCAHVHRCRYAQNLGFAVQLTALQELRIVFGPDDTAAARSNRKYYGTYILSVLLFSLMMRKNKTHRPVPNIRCG